MRDVGGASVAVAGWTLVSRVTGFVRAVVVAAVLGATYLGNTYQAVNVLPNLAFELLTGSLFASLLVPRLVRRLDAGDPEAVRRIAGGFLGVTLLGAALITLATVAAGQLVLGLLSIGVPDPSVAEDQQRVGWVLLALLMPQLALYVLAGTGGAVMNAHGRFALAAAAPALENLGIMATLAATAVVAGGHVGLSEVGTGELLLLGVGTTASVGLHAAAQWWGAWRSGTLLTPRAGWREPEVREVLRLVSPTLAYSGLNALRVYAAIVVANRVPGGVVAFLLAVNFANLPTAIGARPIATAFLPTLSRLAGDRAAFREELVRALGLATFLAVPAAVAYLSLAGPLARAVAVGEMATTQGIALLGAGLAAVAAGVIGEALVVVGTFAAYALRDARTPLRAMVLRTLVTLAGVGLALVVTPGPAVILTLGLALSVGNLASAWQLLHRLRPDVRPVARRLVAPVGRTALASALMSGPAYIVALWVGERSAPVVGVAAAGLVAGAIFLAVQVRLRSPELAFFLGGLRSARAGSPA